MPQIQRATPQRSASPPPALVRHDPKFRPVDGMGDWTSIKNRRPGYHYVWVNKEDTLQGPDFYTSMGITDNEGTEMRYEFVRQGGGFGEPMVPCGVRKDGDIYEFRGYVLMCCPQELKDFTDRFGTNGVTGLEYMKQVEDKISNKQAARQLADGIRMHGQGGEQYFGLENDTSAPVVEYLKRVKE